MTRPYAFSRLCATLLVFLTVSLATAAFEANIIATPDSEYFLPGQRVAFYLDLPEALVHNSNFTCNWALFLESQNGQKLRMPTPHATTKQFDVFLPRAGKYEIRCSYRFRSQQSNFSRSASRSFEVKYHDVEIMAAPEAAFYSPGETIIFSVNSERNAYIPTAKEYFSWQIVTRNSDRMPWQTVKKSTARTFAYTIPRMGEYQVYCSYRIFEGGVFSSTQMLNRKFSSRRILEGAITYQRTGRENAGTPQVRERVILSVSGLAEVTKVIVPDVVYEEKRTPIDPDSVKTWNWQATAGSFDERRAFEKDVAANAKIWTAPDEPGWYDVECAVDVYGNEKLAATFTKAIEVVKRTAPPPVASMEILTPSPITGVFNPFPAVLFSQLCVAETPLHSDKAVYIWEASAGSITSNDKTAAWNYTCNLANCPDSVIISCSLVSSGRTIARGYGKFALKTPENKVSPARKKRRFIDPSVTPDAAPDHLSP